MISSAVCLLRRAVLAFRRWLQEKAGGDVGWAGGATSKDLPAKLSRKEVLNRWDRHGKNCADCTQVNCQCYFWGVDGPMTPLLHPSSAVCLYTCPPTPPPPSPFPNTLTTPLLTGLHESCGSTLSSNVHLAKVLLYLLQVVLDRLTSLYGLILSQQLCIMPKTHSCKAL